MSASREKKKRQELLAGGGVDPKAAREAEKRAAERKSNILYGVVAGIFVVVAVALVVYNSGIIQRNQTAVTIDGEKYTVPQVAYYYQQICNNYASLFGQEYLQTLKTQSYGEDGTWDDYFKTEAVNTMKYTHAAVRAAAEANMTLDSSDEENIKANVDGMKSAASSAGYSYGAYLKAVFGSTMTSSVYESCVRDQMLALKYAADYSENNFVYSDSDVETYYGDNKDAYDVVDGAYVIISGTPEAKTDADGNAVEATEEEKAAALEEAKAKAEEILAAYKSGGDLERLAGDSDGIYSDSVSGSSGVHGEWFYDGARRSGDAEVLADEDNSRYYVAVFNSRDRDRRPATYDVRYILVTADSLDLPEGQEAADEQIKARAEEILAGWDGTEDGFASLANEYSQDGGSNTTGGLYEGVLPGQVTAFEDWCYEDGRKPGDTDIVYNASTGYHIVYFVGRSDTEYWYYACENALRSGAETEWREDLIASTAAEINASGMKQVG